MPFDLSSGNAFPLSVRVGAEEIVTDTTWTKANSPYVFTEEVVVNEGVTLTIEPGVVVRFVQSYLGLTIKGQLVSRGTEAERISFQASVLLADSSFIRFTDTSVDATYDDAGNYADGSIIQYSDIVYEELSDRGVSIVSISNSSPCIDNCVITMTPADEAFTSRRGIIVNEGSPRITNCILQDCGITVYDSSFVLIQGNTISGNRQAYHGGGVRAESSTVIIKNNTITNNQAGPLGIHERGWGGGIYCSGGAAIITNNTVTGNSAVDCGGAIDIDSDCWAIIARNTISQNTADWGGGICVEDGKAIVRGNTITENFGSGVFVWGGQATIENNNITQNDSGFGGIYVWQSEAVINYNNLHSNTDYDLTNNNPRLLEIDATQNWWGTADESTIQNQIWDDFGAVDYVPYAVGPLGHVILPEPTALDISPRVTFVSNQSQVLTATLRNSEGIRVPGAQITWSASTGTFNSSTMFTNRHGQAAVLYTPPLVVIPITVNITASFAGNSSHMGSQTTYTTSVLWGDNDNDGMPDYWEFLNGLNTSVNDAADDPDYDGLSNLEEYQNQTDPNDSDTDDDGLLDGPEVHTHGTDPTISDSDTDGLLDGEEVNTYGTDQNNNDTDSDGLLDGAEVDTYYTDPLLIDTDGDGLSDGAEVLLWGSDPLLTDTDGDGWSDGWEAENGFAPTDSRDVSLFFSGIIFAVVAGGCALVLVRGGRWSDLLDGFRG